jgi:hypothetical protein
MGFDLSKAMLCLDCEFVDAYQICPKCGSKAVFPISRFLNKPLSKIDKGESMDADSNQKES